MSRMLASSLLLSLVAVGSASAGTPRLDEGPAWLRLVARGQEGYIPDAKLPIRGLGEGDTAKLVWKLKGKEFATTKCDSSGECEFDGPSMKLTGAVTAELVLWDDRAEKESVLRTFKFDIHKTGKASWQIVADDVLGGAWVQHEGRSSFKAEHRWLRMYMWSTSSEYTASISARCTVDGVALEQDIAMGGATLIDIEATDNRNRTFHYRKMELGFEMNWGPRDPNRRDYEPKEMLVDHPGAWECRVRREGKTIRELRFTVTADGMIANDEMQSGDKAVPTVDAEVFIDNRLGKDAASFDERFDPAEFKKSLQYGLPWPDHPKVKSIHAAAPGKFGPSL